MWNGKTELVKRTTCQLPFHHGGLAVINPSEKARALKLRWVPQIGDPSCTSNWVFFARYWVGLALSRKVPSWSFLRSNACPKYIGDSPPKYFTHILTAVDRLNVDLTLLLNYRVKTFYEKLTYPSPRRLPTAGDPSPRHFCFCLWGFRRCQGNAFRSAYGKVGHLTAFTGASCLCLLLQQVYQ